MAKILIVDDEQNVLTLLRYLLKENGYEICEAANGLAALKLFETQFFDLIITDVRMPCMDGLSFLREVKRLEPTTPVIILTAYDSVEIAVQAVENGASIYLTKPFKGDELLNIVKRVLATGKGQKTVAPLFTAS